MAGSSEIKMGFYLGVGVFGALLILGMLQAFTLKAVHRNG